MILENTLCIPAEKNIWAYFRCSGYKKLLVFALFLQK